LKIQLKGIDKVNKRFMRVRANLRNAKPVMDTIGAIGFKHIDDHFRKEEGPRGKWQSLKKSTIRQRRKRGGGAKILQDSGRMRGATNFKGKKRHVLLFNKVKYAHYHHDGKGVPKRRFMWIDNKTRRRMAKRYSRFLVTGKA